jgi:hypothetical protein
MKFFLLCALTLSLFADVHWTKSQDTAIYKVCLDSKVYYVSSGFLVPKLVYANYNSSSRPTKTYQATCKESK